MDKMVHDFSIPTIEMSRNAFVRNHTWKGTCDTGKLYPIFFDETLPGDTKQLNTTVFGRLSTPFVPVLDNIYLDIHYFYVPIRLVWDNFKKFFGERVNPDDSIDYLVPEWKAGSDGFPRYGFFDYLGIPPAVPYLSVSSATFYARAYNLIWNEWYRDCNLQNSLTLYTGDNVTSGEKSALTILPRGKRQDYFTSGYTSTQRGGASSIPLSFGNNSTAPVYGDGNGLNLVGYTIDSNPAKFYSALIAQHGISNANYTDGVNYYARPSTIGSDDFHVDGTTYQISPSTLVSNHGDYSTHDLDTSQASTATPFKPLGLPRKGVDFYGMNNNTQLMSHAVADLSSVTINAPTINSLRQAIALQQFLERDMFNGCRYRELLYSHYSVRVPDYTIQIPEYLGGGTVRVNINPIAQTSSTDSTTPQGNLAATGTVAGSDIGFTHSFDEPGVILGLASFRSDITYQQGVDRHFLRNTRYDYFFPCLSHLGMQGVYNKEIYAQGDAVLDSDGETIIDNQLFNYNMRYDEYRFKNSYITSKFRSSDPQSLDVWHLAENFDNKPVFNDEFIKVSDTVNRVVAVQDEPEFLLDVYHDFTDVREVPMYGMPGLTRI